MSNDKLGDLGSLVPLNLRQRPGMVLPEYTVKAQSHAERVETASRAGTPPTRWGAFNGLMPSTSPGIPTELNPSLVLKAVTNPAEAGGEHNAGNSRKRDPATGKFADTSSVGPSTTASEDLAITQRAAHLSQARHGTGSGKPTTKPKATPSAAPKAGKSYSDVSSKKADEEDENDGDTDGFLKALDMASMGNAAGQTTQPPQMFKPKPSPMQQAGIAAGPPGQTPNNTFAGATQDPSGDPAMGPPPLGNLQDGSPVMDDPYSPAHANFTPDQHQEAAELHNRHAEMATQSGRIPTAMNHQMKANIHGELAQDSQSPMERVLATQGMPGQGAGDPNAMPGSVPGVDAVGGEQAQGQDPMDSFLTNMSGDKQPGQQNNFDQGKPPQPSGADVAGPLPRMINTHTNSPIGPQSQQGGNAGTVEQPQVMPPEPPPGNGSMPDISGPQMPQQTNKDPMDWDPNDLAVDGDDEGGSGDAPPSHAGAKTDTLQPEAREEASPGSAEGGPPQFGAGPTTSDAPGGQGTEEEEYGEPSGVDAVGGGDQEGPEGLDLASGEDTGAPGEDEVEGSADGAPFSGNQTEDVADEEAAEAPPEEEETSPEKKFAQKSFNNWFQSI